MPEHRLGKCREAYVERGGDEAERFHKQFVEPLGHGANRAMAQLYAGAIARIRERMERFG